jgi:hypothetical protein
MNFVALKMLFGDRAKYLGIIMGLTFASLLITTGGDLCRPDDAHLRVYHRHRAPRPVGHGPESTIHR